MNEGLKNLKDYSEDVYKCSKCGLCQSVCPVYKATGKETAVSRGKFTLLNGIILGKLKFNKKTAKTLDLCLGCKACKDFCPSGIDAEEIITAARADSFNINGVGFIKSFILANFSSNFMLYLLKTALGIYRAMNLSKVTGFLINKYPSVLDKCGLKQSLALFESMLKINVKYKKLNPAKPVSDLKIIYFPGCIGNYVNPSVKNAVLMVLEKNGFNVLIPENFSCCGIAARSAGDFEGMRKLAQKNIDLIPDDTDYVITDCASCGSAWEFYPEYVEDKYKDKALKIAKRCINIYKFLDNIDLQISDNIKLDKKITYHDPCHLKRFQNVYEEPRKFLKQMPGVEFKEMKDADVCCGAAGTFCLSQQEISTVISADKAQNILDTNADIVCSSCAGCQIGLYQGLIQKQSKIPVYNPVELLAKIYTEELKF